MNSVSLSAQPAERRPVLWLLVTIALAVYFFGAANVVLDASLDASNYASYTHFAAQQKQFGTEVVPMAGPYGFVMYGFVYSGELYGTRLILEGLTKLAFAALLVWFFRRVTGDWVRWIWLAAHLLVLPTTTELTYDLCVLYAAFYLVIGKPRLLIVVGVSALLAFLALCKGTQLFFTLAVLGVVALEALWRRAWRELAAMLGGFFVTLDALWLIAGQRLTHLSEYVRNIQELSSGYNSGMALQENRLTQIIGLISASLLIGSIALLWLPHRRSSLITAIALILGGFTFLEWKHGFVRADGHVFLYFDYAVLGSLTVLLVARAAQLEGVGLRVRQSICAVAVIVAIYANGEQVFARLQHMGSVAARHLPENLQQVFRPGAYRAELETKLANNRIRFALPEITETVGKDPTSFFGYQSGYLPLNGLNYRPSPVAGGGPFSVFTRHLQMLNENFVRSPATRPHYYLVKLQTIDERLVSQDDAGSLNAILHLYEPVLGERDMLLFKAKPGENPIPALRELGSSSIANGVSVAIPPCAPDELVLARFNLPPSLTARIRGALYKSPIVTLELGVEGRRGPTVRRIIPLMASQPFMISPFLDRTADLVGLYAANSGERVQNLTLRVDPANGLDRAGGTVTFYAQKRPAAISPGLAAKLKEQLEYQMANRAPKLVESPNARTKEVDGRIVQHLEPPGKLVFSLTGSERELYFDYGFDPESYERGKTDGADFIAELVSGTNPPQILFQSRRTPVTAPADRGRHHAHVFLPPVILPGDQLVLRITGGVALAADWDWTYFDNIRLHEGAYHSAQFPGFRSIPNRVEGAAPQIISHENRPVLLLNAPGKLSFKLAGTERRLRFSAGLIPGSYLEGNTDGVEYVIEARSPDGQMIPLFKRFLEPKTVASDRGTQPIEVTLPSLPSGSELWLRIEPGPRGDLGWDWSYVGDVQLD